MPRHGHKKEEEEEENEKKECFGACGGPYAYQYSIFVACGCKRDM